MFTFLYEWICGWCTVCLLCLYQSFMIIWVGEKNIFPLNCVIGLCFYFYVWTAGDMRSQYTDATGLWYKEKKRAVAETVANVLLNYFLVVNFGVSGIVVATAISIVVVGLPWSNKIIFDNYFKKQSCMKYMSTQLVYAVMTLISCFVTFFVCEQVQVVGILGLMIKGIICVILPNVLYLVMSFKMPIAREALGFVKNNLLKGR